MSAARPLPPRECGEIEPLTPEQRAAAARWKAAGGTVDPAVLALHKRARGEALTPAEAALLVATPETRARIAALGPGVPHEQVKAELAERQRREG